MLTLSVMEKITSAKTQKIDNSNRFLLPLSTKFSMQLPRIAFSSFVILLFIIFLFPTISFAQDSTQKKGGDTVKLVPDGTEGVQLAIRKEGTMPKQLPPNEFEGSASTFRIGMGYIGDFTTHIQSKEFKQQMDSAGLDVVTKYKTRDFRILGSGVLKTKRYIAWKFAFMYDGDKEVWMLRETGITIAVPELFGHLFIGRTKEGFALLRVMNGHSGWGNERPMTEDVIPILADGIKWFGMIPKANIFWNLGYYNDFISKGQSFSTFSSQFVARIGWLPINQVETETTLHIAANLRYAKPLDGKIELKSRPESNPTPQIIFTGKFESDHSTHVGYEIFYRRKQFMIGSEYNFHNFHSDIGESHLFQGGDIMVSYFFTKTYRPYKTEGSIFGFVPVRKSVFKGGWGEIEAVVRYSKMNLDDGSIKGGKFWRLTPMINWYLSRALRWEFIYGYGVLDRYGLQGAVQFIETRLQLTVM